MAANPIFVFKYTVIRPGLFSTRSNAHWDSAFYSTYSNARLAFLEWLNTKNQQANGKEVYIADGQAPDHLFRQAKLGLKTA